MLTIGKTKVKVYHRPITFVDYRGTINRSEVSGVWTGEFIVCSRRFVGVREALGNTITLIWEHDIIYIEFEEDTDENQPAE